MVDVRSVRDGRVLVLLLVSGASCVGKSTVRRLLDGRFGPGLASVELRDLAEVPAAPTLRWRQQTAEVAACLLDADPPAQTARLRARGEPEALLDAHLAFAAWLRGHARDPGRDGRWVVPAIDTSRLTSVEAADEVAAWVRAAVARRAPVFHPGWHRSAGPGP